MFVRTGPSSREAIKCLRCRSSPRGRALFTVLDREVPDWANRSIYEAGTGGAFSDRIAKSCDRYTGSLFFDDVPRGRSVAGIRSEDLEALTLEDASFDVVISQDVLEHVFHPDRAFAEIARVLKADGVHLFTVPYAPALETSQVRAEMGPDGVRHLQPPAFHDDLLNPAGVLVVTDWGIDLPTFVRRSAGMETEVVVLQDRRRGIPEPVTLFISRRLPAVHPPEAL